MLNLQSPAATPVIQISAIPRDAPMQHAVPRRPVPCRARLSDFSIFLQPRRGYLHERWPVLLVASREISVIRVYAMAYGYAFNTYRMLSPVFSRELTACSRERNRPVIDRSLFLDRIHHHQIVNRKRHVTTARSILQKKRSTASLDGVMT